MPAPPPPPETRWKPGTSPNPGGKPTGARNRLTAAFLNALAQDFDAHGVDAIKDCRERKPEAYIKAIAALCPKELELKTPLQDATEDELRTLLGALRGARNADREGIAETNSSAPTH